MPRTVIDVCKHKLPYFVHILCLCPRVSPFVVGNNVLLCMFVFITLWIVSPLLRDGAQDLAHVHQMLNLELYPLS